MRLLDFSFLMLLLFFLNMLVIQDLNARQNLAPKVNWGLLVLSFPFKAAIPVPMTDCPLKSTTVAKGVAKPW